MSGNAALAAAKRRRNPVDGPSIPNQQTVPSKNVSFTSNMQDTQDLKVYRDNAPTTPIKTILEHDRQIFYLERKVEELELSRDNDTVATDPQTENNNQEIKLLKSTILKQQKSIQELTSLVTNLKGSIITQNNSIDSLTERLDHLNTNELSTIKEEVKKEIGSKGTVNLEINDK